MSVIFRPRRAALNMRRWCRTLGFERTYKYPNRLSTPTPDWETDFLIAVPSEAVNTPEGWGELRWLYTRNKWLQRAWCYDEGIPTPLDVENALRYVRRPFKHRAGQGFEVFDTEQPITLSSVFAQNNDPAASHYVSPLFERTHEYRIVTHKGKVVCTILKKNDGLPQDVPWGHEGSTFVTVRNPDNNRLRHTDVYEKINNPVFNSAHLLGVDILYNHNTRKYAVTEINFAPTITIPANIEELKNVIHS